MSYVTSKFLPDELWCFQILPFFQIRIDDSLHSPNPFLHLVYNLSTVNRKFRQQYQVRVHETSIYMIMDYILCCISNRNNFQYHLRNVAECFEDITYHFIPRQLNWSPDYKFYHETHYSRSQLLLANYKIPYAIKRWKLLNSIQNRQDAMECLLTL